MSKPKKPLLFGLLVIIVALTILFKFAELEKITKLFLQANYFFILAAFASQGLVYFSIAKTYETIIRGFGNTLIRIKALIKTAIVMLFLNQALPSMGISGNTYFFSMLKKNDTKSGESIFMVIFNMLVLYSAYLASITLSVIYLLFKGNLTALQLTAAIIMGIATVVLIAFVTFITKEESRVRKFLKLISVFFPMGAFNADEIASELYSSRSQISKEKRVFAKAILFRISSFLFECVTIYMIFLALHLTPNFIAIIVAYLMAHLFALITFVPGGLGVFEGTMILTLKGFGIPYEAALIATLMYRAFAFWLPMPAGLWLYRHPFSPIDH